MIFFLERILPLKLRGQQNHCHNQKYILIVIMFYFVYVIIAPRNVI